MKRWYAPSAFLFIFLFLVVVVVHGDGAGAGAGAGAGDDSETMHALSLLVPPSSTKWNTTNPNPCKWNGVNCTTTTTQVLSLSLSGFGLSNASHLFFPLLCKLTSLRSLDLSLNSLSSIPAPFLSSSDTCTGLSHLTSLNLSSNNLAGPLPNFSATFAALETLDLSANHLEGEVGPQLSALNSLKALSLANNLFTGAIPPLPVGLRQLVLSFNSFTGSIPNATTLLNLKNLTLLDLASNLLSGPIPDAIGELSNLKHVQLSANRLSGEIPVGLASIASLRYFGANQNMLSGTIPPGLTRYVTVLDLSYNDLSGQIPPDLLSPPALLYVDLSYNRLGGTIPANLSSGLFRLRLSGNSLGGTVPTTIGSSSSSSSLTYLELDNNKLDGEIPRQLGDCRNLTLLNLAGNRLHGTLPMELGNLKEMVIIYLQDNHLTGGIPKELLRLGQLITLNISRNFLSGAIPPEISSLQKLARLNLEGNGLNGSIPETINALQNLIELQLGNNKLNGVVPRMPISLSLALNLSSNSFAGPIPSYLAGLQQLEILDLSNNEFSGQVPSSLILMQSLTQLVLSNNRLSGTFPTFPSYVHVNAAGNKDLVFPPPPAPGASSKRKSSRVLIVVVAVVSAVIGLGLAAAVLLLCVSNRVYRVEDQVEDAILQLEERPQIISGCFLTSNSIHKSNIDFIRAMEVARSPSNITLKTRFSTYYRAEMPSGMKYSVKKLNWSEKIFQMGSPERFGQELEVLGRLSNSNLMVPLAYVLTEDDAYLFYESVHEGTLFDFLHKGSESSLDWQSRYSIALGVAQGLSFLHGCVQPVLLMDLSTKSIHLKSKSEPQIGDIELCKVIDPSKSTGNLSTVAGSVGYIPPEYAYTMRVTMSGNVYSFGVILLELLTGKPPVSHGVELAKWASSFSGKLGQEQILDSSVCGTSPASRSQMMSVLKVALSCVSSSPDARPKMRNVSSMLLNA